MQNELQFMEIEHKFIVEEDFNLSTFRTKIEQLNPIRTSSIRVSDRYFLTGIGQQEKFLLRHRYDPELHQLTLKTLERDTEIRSEINLDLGHHAGAQEDAVDAFLAKLGVRWSGTLHKDIEAWYFPDIEIVHYRAETDTRTVRCVEFEATNKSSIGAALGTLKRYELKTGFAAHARSSLSLPQILFPEIANALGS